MLSHWLWVCRLIFSFDDNKNEKKKLSHRYKYIFDIKEEDKIIIYYDNIFSHEENEGYLYTYLCYFARVIYGHLWNF